MISAVSSFSALTSNSKIIASASDAAPVQQIQRVKRRSAAVDDINSNQLLQNKSNAQPVDKLTLLGENALKTGKAYGMEANELRKQGLKNQLIGSDEEENSENNMEIMGEDSIEESSDSEKNEAEKSKENNNTDELTPKEQEEVAKLKERDLEVKTHEQAHLAAAGGLAQGGASYEYQQGPDGNRYAVGGEVSIDTSPASTPEATIQKMQQVRAAALAPAEPSSQDRSVAASAAQQMSEARQEMNSESSESTDEAEAENSINKEEAENKNSEGISAEGTEKPRTIEEMQEKSIEDAISGESNNKITETGMIEVPMPQINDNNVQSSANSVPISKLAIQQYAARIAYGIPA